MSIVKAIFSNFLAFLLSIFVTLFPYAGIKLPVITTEKEDCRLNMEIMSDIHITKRELLRPVFLKTALCRINDADCVDAIVIPGDVTNYADEESLSAFFDIMREKTDIPAFVAAGNHDIGHAGDRDVTDISREQARDNFIRYRNEYTGRSDTANYYADDINGYHVIVIGDEVIDGGHWDAISMSDEQLAFLDRELAVGTAEGKPCFVISHWPLDGTTGEDVIWDGSGIEQTDYDIRSILEKYPNVCYISGHMHSGVKATALNDWYGLSNAEKINGVIYLNLPSFGLVNTFGIPVSGTGAQLEVYDDEIIFRPCNYLTGHWYENSVYHFTLD